jgi:hypothetical protein
MCLFGCDFQSGGPHKWPSEACIDDREPSQYLRAWQVTLALTSKHCLTNFPRGKEETQR